MADYTNNKADGEIMAASDLEAIETAVATKANKISGGTANNVVEQDVNGDIVDTGLATPSSAFVGISDTQTFTNKTIGDSNTINAQDDAFTIDDAADATLQIDFNAAGTTGTKTTITSSQTANRVITLPDSTTTLLGASDIGSSVQAYDADTTKNDVANSFTAIQKWAKGADIASASALTLGTDGNYFDVTGTTTITSIGTAGVGTVVKLHFDGALTLTHHATDLILPGGANITTAAGDEAEFIEYATGDWRCTNYSRYSADRISSQVFTSSGTWNKPANLKHAVVIVVGGGGSGGGSSASGGGHGGGAGGYAIELISAGSLGSTETVTIGSGGLSVSSNTDGNSGGSSSFGAHCSATGGSGGRAPVSGSGSGAAGVGSGGDLNGQGSSGGAGSTLYSGAGGSSYFGGGGNPARGVAGVAGVHGGGGSGGGADGGLYSSGAGGDGVVYVWEYF